MPILTQGSQVDVTFAGDSTLLIQSPGGFYEVQYPIGTVIFRGSDTSRSFDLNSGSARIVATTRDLTYYVSSDRAGVAPMTAEQTAAGAIKAVGETLSGNTVGGSGRLGPPIGCDAPLLNGASAGADSGWVPLSANPERLVWALDSGTTATTFSIDISADGVTSLGQAFTGTCNTSTTAEFSPPLMFTNPQARFYRVTVLSGGPLSMNRGA